MPGHDIIAVGASAGGLRTLGDLLATVPPDIQASFLVVQHLSPEVLGAQAALLQRQTDLVVETAADRSTIERGHVYVAPPDHHLLVDEQAIRVVRGPKENLHRPAIDVLFRSAAVAYGTRTIGVVLSGSLDDGSAGLAAIKTCGGLAVVQDPTDALYGEMPANALEATTVDHCVTIEKMGPLLAVLAAVPADDRNRFPVPERIRIETQFAMLERNMSSMNQLGSPSEVACPACHGALWEVESENRFRCHTGHAYSLEALAQDQSRAVEDALFAAVRAIAENIAVARRLAQRYSEPERKARQEEKVREMSQAADTLRALLVGASIVGGERPVPPAEVPLSAREPSPIGQENGGSADA